MRDGSGSVVDSGQCGHPLRCPWWTLLWSLEEGGGQQVEQMIIEGSCKIGWKCSRHTGYNRMLSTYVELLLRKWILVGRRLKGDVFKR